MNTSWLSVVLLFLLSAPLLGAQQTCPASATLSGNITDQTGANIPGATITAPGVQSVTSDAVGHYALACVPAGQVTLEVSASGFETKKVQVRKRADQSLRFSIQLAIETVQEDVQVNGGTGGESGGGAGTTILNKQQVQQLADDPDDFLRQLQVLASNGGGPPESALVVIDGFQNASALPPKASIASIRINPDLFSSEYELPPWSGGRIEITTKPGAGSLHGAVFYIDSDGSFNATDPFSVTATPAGKRRYGFELSGPVVAKKSDFALSFEKRDIDEFNIVNATTLDANFTPTPFHETVEAPQRLWIASARGDWQLTPNDLATASFSANVNNLGNQGVGGLGLPEAGYASLSNEYDLRFTNTWTVNANLLHQTHLGYTWKRSEHIPTSTSPSLQVAGYFTGGGDTSQALNDRERDLEVDHDVTYVRGRHTLKFGVQALGVFVHDYDPDTFNGAYTFGGGEAPVLDSNNAPTGQTETITPIEQYRRTLLDLSGGAPTTYQVTSGTPLVPLTQWRVGMYAQDSIKLSEHLTIASGLRYQFQTTPNTFTNFAPRIAINWAPDKKETWMMHLRGGLFVSNVDPSFATTIYRLNGTRQQQVTVYSPSYQTPLSSTPGATQVGTTWRFPPSFEQLPYFSSQVGVEHDFLHHWHGEVDFNYGDNWDGVTERNINAPMVASETGVAPNPNVAILAPRPYAPDMNILEYQNASHLRGGMLVTSIRQAGYKRFTISANYLHMFPITSDSGTTIASPQSSYTNNGESTRPDWYMPNVFALFGTLELPYKFEFSEQFDTRSGLPYNITTGTDNNGDGNFNDRPAYATASDSGSGVYTTRFGTMTTNTINGNVPRNLGTMPALVHLDLNLSRAFTLNPKDKNRPLTLTFNARSANVLNHVNVTTVNTVLSSGSVGQSLAAEAARRIELGARFTF